MKTFARPEAGTSSAPLLTAMFLLVFGTNLLGVILPIRGHERGSSMLAIGLYSAAWSAGFIAASAACGAILARFGHRRGFLGLALLSGVLALLFPLLPHDVFWIAFRLVSGFSYGGSAAIIEAWLLETSTDGRSFGRYVVTTLVASLFGTLSLNLVRPESQEPFLLSGGCLLLSLLPMLRGKLTAPPRPPAFSPDLGLFVRRSPLATTGCLLAGMMTGAVGGLGPVFGMLSGLDMRNDTLMLAANSIGGALGYAPLSALARRDRRVALMAAATLGLGASLLAAWLMPGVGAGSLIGLLFVIGCAQYPIYGLAVGLACAEAPDRPVPAVSSEGILIFGLGTVMGPIACSQFLRLGLAALPVLLAVGFAVLLLCSICSAAARRGVPQGPTV